MKKVLAIAVAASALFFACLKTTNTPPVATCTPVAPALEAATIKSFLGNDSTTYTKDTSYIFYKIKDSGTGASATGSSIIFFTYSAALLDGTLVSQSNVPVQQAVVNLITGFQDMARFFKKGSHIIMVIPSQLAYSCAGVTNQNGQVVIPSNAIVYYDVKITDIQ